MHKGWVSVNNYKKAVGVFKHFDFSEVFAKLVYETALLPDRNKQNTRLFSEKSHFRVYQC